MQIDSRQMLPDLVTWRDAETFGDADWQELDDVSAYLAKPSPVMTTIGFLLYEREGDGGYLCLTDTYGSDETSHVHKIPTAMILTRVQLTECRN